MGFRLLGLLLSLFLVPVSTPAHAAITAAFESPPAGPVAGVQVVRGWAFVTEPGDTIARVELVVDGAPAMTIPCCGSAPMWPPPIRSIPPPSPSTAAGG